MANAKRLAAETETAVTFFDKSKGFLRPAEVADQLGIKVSTIYDWKYRPARRQTPEGLFIRFNGQLLVRTEVLNRWISLKAAKT